MWESLDRAGRMIDLYRAAADSCTEPVGAFVNNQVGFFTFVHCAETDEQAMLDGAAAAAAWYTVTALNFFEAADAFVENLAREANDAPTEAKLLIGRILQGEKVSDDEVFTVLSAQDSLIVGSPETCRRKLKAYADLGIDRMMCLQQMGGIGHEEVMESIRLVGGLIPDFDLG